MQHKIKRYTSLFSLKENNKQTLIKDVLSKDRNFKIIPLGKYVGDGKAHDCDKNSLKYKETENVYKGYLIAYDPNYNSYTSVSHIFNVKNGQVIEHTDLYLDNEKRTIDNLVYVGKPVEKEFLTRKKIWYSQ